MGRGSGGGGRSSAGGGRVRIDRAGERANAQLMASAGIPEGNAKVLARIRRLESERHVLSSKLPKNVPSNPFSAAADRYDANIRRQSDLYERQRRLTRLLR